MELQTLRGSLKVYLLLYFQVPSFWLTNLTQALLYPKNHRCAHWTTLKMMRRQAEQPGIEPRYSCTAAPQLRYHRIAGQQGYLLRAGGRPLAKMVGTFLEQSHKLKNLNDMRKMHARCFSLSNCSKKEKKTKKIAYRKY